MTTVIHDILLRIHFSQYECTTELLSPYNLFLGGNEDYAPNPKIGCSKGPQTVRRRTKLCPRVK
jgi:hypothetical protein